MVVDAIIPYNMIMVILALNQLGVVISTPHLCMKYPLDQYRIGKVRANQKIARKC